MKTKNEQNAKYPDFEVSYNRVSHGQTPTTSSLRWPLPRSCPMGQEARRRRQSIISSDCSRKRRQGSEPIQFGQDGKPSLSPINTRSR